MSLLEHLFTKYGTDKGIWGYTPAYEKFLEHRRLLIRKVLEIGVCGARDIPNNVTGASLFAWREYFPNAQIYGLDNDARWMVNDEPRIKTFHVDAYDSYALGEVMAKIGWDIDFICDDAVHDPIPQINLINDLWPFLARGGVYAIEEACPYKVPNGALAHMIRNFPKDVAVTEFQTHKDERLLIVTHR